MHALDAGLRHLFTSLRSSALFCSSHSTPHFSILAYASFAVSLSSVPPVHAQTVSTHFCFIFCSFRLFTFLFQPLVSFLVLTAVSLLSVLLFLANPFLLFTFFFFSFLHFVLPPCSTFNTPLYLLAPTRRARFTTSLRLRLRTLNSDSSNVP